MAEHNIIGQEGEKAAVDYLISKGYKIHNTNWRKGRYELDIIAQTSDELVVVEVKTRSGNPMVAPEIAVDNKKIRNIISATDLYINIYDIDLPVRFDIISVTGYFPHFIIEHIEDAFYPPVNTYW
ncbi:UPF0102 protein [Bacteroidales bacterium]|nr:UPF0102 protein [Bacteroidales bacterium]